LLSIYGRNYNFIVILLLVSPALSLLGLLGFGYFPNEKLAILLVAISKYAWKRSFSQLRLLSVIIASVFIMLILCQVIAGVNEIQRAGINTVVIILSIPLYASFLSHNPNKTFKLIFFVGVIQLLISLFQQAMAQAGYSEVIQLFNNYPPQQFYTFGVGETGYFYRTSGLFTESSSYAVFQWLAIISGITIGVHKISVLGKIILSLLIVEVILNGSLAGYFFAMTYFIFQGRQHIINNAKLLVFLTIFLFLSTLFLTDLFNVENLINKISNQFNFIYDISDTSPSRLRGMVESISYILTSDHVLYGVGLSWLNPTLDFTSLYLKGFGVIGFIFLVVYVLFIISHAPLNYALSVLIVLAINGHMSSSINVLLLSYSYLYFSSRHSFNLNLKNNMSVK